MSTSTLQFLGARRYNCAQLDVIAFTHLHSAGMDIGLARAVRQTGKELRVSGELRITGATAVCHIPTRDLHLLVRALESGLSAGVEVGQADPEGTRLFGSSIQGTTYEEHADLRFGNVSFGEPVETHQVVLDEAERELLLSKIRLGGRSSATMPGYVQASRLAEKVLDEGDGRDPWQDVMDLLESGDADGLSGEAVPYLLGFYASYLNSGDPFTRFCRVREGDVLLLEHGPRFVEEVTRDDAGYTTAFTVRPARDEGPLSQPIVYGRNEPLTLLGRTY